MVNGVHVLFYTADPDADRGFFRDVLGFAYVDVGHSWLIFALPPAEAAFHPLDPVRSSQPSHKMLGADVYLMCDDVRATVRMLETKGVACTAIEQERWGLRTTVRLPSGGELGLYQPTHETAHTL